MVKLDDFQTKPNGEVWNLNIEDYNDDSRIYSKTKYKKKLDSGLQFKKSSTKILVQTSTGYTPNGIQDNHDDASHQGYMLAPNDFKNVIQFVTLDIKKIDKKKGTVSFAFRGGVREKDRRCEGCGYVLTYQRNGAVYVSKLQFYKGGEVEEKRQIGQVPLGTGKIGLGGLCYNVTENGIEKVVVKGLISSLENDEWVEIGKTVDEGGWGNSDKCSTTVDKILTFGSPIARFETRKIKDFILMSAGVREIVAPGSENPNPTCKKGYYYNTEKKKCIPVLEPDPDIFEGEDDVKADAADIIGEVKVGATVVLDGSGSSGPIKRFEWKQLLGPQAILQANPLQFSNQFVVTSAMQGQTLEFQLTVFGEEATNIDSESISIVVEGTPEQPVLNMNFPTSIEMLKTGLIDGSLSVADVLTLAQTTTKNINLQPEGTKWKWTFVPPNETGSYQLGFHAEATKGTKMIQKDVNIQVTKTGGGTGGKLLYDSNIHGLWNNGQRRVVTGGEGNQDPDGKGLHTAASGDPELTIEGNGISHLESSRWGRIYIYANNYNFKLEGFFMFETNHGEADNISIKLRSRHGNNNHPQGGSNEFGGIGFAFHPSGQVEIKAEIKHGGSSFDFGNLQGPALKLNEWHKYTISGFDENGGITVSVSIDDQSIGSKKWANPHATAIDRSAFDADSYFWIRLNCHDGNRAKAAIKDLKLFDLT